MPLNIDWQQILLHLFNFAILAGGLYILLFKPVKNFMEKRENYYKNMDDSASKKLKEAEDIKAQYEDKMKNAEEEITKSRLDAIQEAEALCNQKIEKAKAEAEEITKRASESAALYHDKALADAKRDLALSVAEAAKKLASADESKLYDEFIRSAEAGGNNGKR